ncbi:hypothetical protein BDF19DRAFT_424808 [Syncephalis fuscata]|nr:hypothetical protein BDF19DRAFT_424808 [Syncephalis fuscata]
MNPQVIKRGLWPLVKPDVVKCKSLLNQQSRYYTRPATCWIHQTSLSRPIAIGRPSIASYSFNYQRLQQQQQRILVRAYHHRGPSFWKQLTPLSKVAVVVGVGGVTLFVFPPLLFIGGLGYGVYHLAKRVNGISSSSSARHEKKRPPDAEDIIRNWFHRRPPTAASTSGSGMHPLMPFGPIGLFITGIARLVQGLAGSIGQVKIHADKTHRASIEQIEHSLRYDLPYSMAMQQETANSSNGRPISFMAVEIRFVIRSHRGDLLADVTAIGQPRHNNDIHLQRLYLQSLRTGQRLELPLNNRHRGGGGGGNDKIIDADYRVL